MHLHLNVKKDEESPYIALNSRGLKSLVNIPQTLVGLTIVDIKFDCLPAILPECLRRLKLNNNDLVHIEAFPGGLTAINICSNRLELLPALPTSLVELFATYNSLTDDSIREFPPGLKTLSLYSNKLTKGPRLPDSMSLLNLESNLITELAPLPRNLHSLKLGYNKLETIPPIPDSVVVLHLSGNYLVEVPRIPNGLYELSLFNNVPMILTDLRNANNLAHFSVGFKLRDNHCMYTQNLVIYSMTGDSLRMVMCVIKSLTRAGLPRELTRVLFEKFLGMDAKTMFSPLH